MGLLRGPLTAAGPPAALLLVTVLLAGGCSSREESEPEAPTKAVAATDGSFEVAVPEGWTTMGPSLAGDVVVAERDPGGRTRLVASHEDGEVGAEQRAITAAGRLSGDGVFCERLDGDETFGEPHLVFDCPLGEGLRQLLVPMVGEGESALLGIRVGGETLADTAEVVGPILRSFAWTDGAS